MPSKTRKSPYSIQIGKGEIKNGHFQNIVIGYISPQEFMQGFTIKGRKIIVNK